MSATVEASHDYDHDIETVYRAFTDPAFYLAKFQGVGARNVEVLSSGEEDGLFTIETRREVPLDVPAALKAILGDWTTVLQNEEWCEGAEGEYMNELAIDSAGVPARMSGSMVLSATDTGCRNDVTITISTSIPLIGGKLEKFIAGNTDDQLAEEYDFIRGYLANL